MIDIRVEGLVKSFDLEKKILDGLTFQIDTGERVGLLGRLILEDTDVLLLDEPTNHLDLPSVECLEEALAAYEGSLVLVSHDDRLLSRLATRRWFLCPTGIPASRVLLREGAREG